jgi:hypothetical protein
MAVLRKAVLLSEFLILGIYKARDERGFTELTIDELEIELEYVNRFIQNK